MILGIEAAQVFALAPLVIKNVCMLVIALIVAFFVSAGLSHISVAWLKSYKLSKFLYDKEVELMLVFTFIVYLILILIWGYN